MDVFLPIDLCPIVPVSFQHGQLYPLVSRFRSSYHFSEPHFELRNRKDPGKPIDLVWLWFRSPHDEPAAQMMRTSEPPHQGPDSEVRIIRNDANFLTATLARPHQSMLQPLTEFGSKLDRGHRAYAACAPRVRYRRCRSAPKT